VTGLDLLEPEEAAALAAAVESLRADLGDDVRIGLFGSRARRDHRPESDFDLLCLMPDGLAVDFEVVDNNVVSAMAEYGGAANVQYLQESRLEDLYFEHAYLPNALREWIDVTDPCLLVLAASEV
jgi:predicted nucleotidyltransferase